MKFKSIKSELLSSKEWAELESSVSSYTDDVEEYINALIEQEGRISVKNIDLSIVKQWLRSNKIIKNRGLDKDLKTFRLEENAYKLFKKIGPNVIGDIGYNYRMKNQVKKGDQKLAFIKRFKKYAMNIPAKYEEWVNNVSDYEYNILIGAVLEKIEKGKGDNKTKVRASLLHYLSKNPEENKVYALEVIAGIDTTKSKELLKKRRDAISREIEVIDF